VETETTFPSSAMTIDTVKKINRCYVHGYNYLFRRRRRRRRRRRNLLCIGKTNNTNNDVTTSTKVLCRAARIAEIITAGRPIYIKFTQAVNKTTPPTNPWTP